MIGIAATSRCGAGRRLRLLVAGGGTGGHVYPGLAVAEALGSATEAPDIRFAGTGRGLESQLVPRAGYRLYKVPSSGFRGLNHWARIQFVVNFQLGLWRSLALLIGWRPDAVLGTGGYASAPVVIAARMLRIKCALQEQNAYPGSANRLLARWAQRIYLGVPAAKRFFPAELCRETGNPVRRAFLAQTDRAPARSNTAAAGVGGSGSEASPPHSDDVDEVRVLIFGGSRGARSLNDALQGAVNELAADQRLTLWIQTGTADCAAVTAAFASWGQRARVVSYILDMPTALRWADLAVCRAGAMTLAELAAAGRPAILVPFPHATDDHQLHNARALAAAGAALVLEDRDCTPARLTATIGELTADRSRVATMAAAARKMARPDAAQEIAADLLVLAGWREDRLVP